MLRQHKRRFFLSRFDGERPPLHHFSYSRQGRLHLRIYVRQMVAAAGSLGREYQTSSEVTFNVRKSRVEAAARMRAKMFNGVVLPDTVGTSLSFPHPFDPHILS